MNNSDKSKKQLLKEIELLSTKIGKLEILEIERKQAENALNESEEKFRVLYESSQDAIMMLAPPTWLFTAGNQATIKMFHAKNEKEFISKEPWELSPEYQPDGQLSSEKAKKMIQKAMKTGSNFFEWTHNRINGEDFPATVLLTRIELKDKQLLQATVRDITKRKTIEEELNKHRQHLEELVDERTKELKESEEKHRKLIETTSEGFWLISSEKKTIDVNQSLCDMLGYSKDEMIRKTPFDFVDEVNRKIFSEQILLSKSTKHRAYEVLLRKKNGTNFPTLFSATTLIDKDGNNAGAFAFIKDITERKKAEAELLKSEKQYRRLIDALPQNIYQLDKNLRYITANKAYCESYSISREEIRGRSSKDFFPEKQAENFMASDKEVLDSGKMKNYTEISTSIGKGDRWFQIVKVPMKDENDNVEGMLGIYWDVTKHIKAEEDLKSGRERLTMLNKIIRHDISNDFIVIQSAINIFRRTPDPKMIDEMESRVEKSLKTIDNYRKYEAFINSNADLDEIKITEKIKNIITYFPKIKFNVEGECKVFADEALDPVFTNLISNSIKHGKASQIEIKISSEDNLCEIRFMDNGMGIPDEIKDKIFDEGFFHGKDGHTGIGLHIVKKTIERYGGHISVEDNRPKGAVFVINLKKAL